MKISLGVLGGAALVGVALVAGAMQQLVAAEPKSATEEKLAALPVNKWVTLYDGPPVTGYMNRMHWLADKGVGLIWTANVERNDNPYALAQFSVATGKWTVKPGALPAGYDQEIPAITRNYGIDRTPSSTLYLPTLGKLLVLHPSGGKAGAAYTWLVDPDGGTWKAGSDQRLSQTGSEFNTQACREGSPVPMWGALCYDEGNQEAVSICGGATWGRVGEKQEKVGPGDWVYDEKLKRVRRLTADDEGKITGARKWYPGACGTWTFSPADMKWRMLDQPLGLQPSGRWFPGAAYDAAEKKIVLFGGDNDARVLGDTWIYDCKARTWQEAKPKTSPPPRAGQAMVYLPKEQVVLLAGGYVGGWQATGEVWVYRTAANEWTRLGLDLPAPTQQCSAAYEPVSGAALLFAPQDKSRVYALRLDLAKAPTGVAANAAPEAAYHCKNYHHKKQVTFLPNEWLAGEGAPEDEKTVRARLAALPANTWKLLELPRKAPTRIWGRDAYDKESHTVFAFGGSHFGYNGTEFSEYSLLTNRWRAMADPTTYRPYWTHSAASTHHGVNFSGWENGGGHTMQALAFDPVSRSVVNVAGEAYSARHHLVVASLGEPPGGDPYNRPYVTTPSGLYCYRPPAGLSRADLEAGKWVPVGGPIPAKDNYYQYDHMVYDSKRDQILYLVSTSARVWAFDLATKKWSEEEPAGKKLKAIVPAGDYLPELDAVLLVFSEGDAAPANMHLYKVGERKWYTAPYLGDKMGPYGNLNNTTFYDPELKLAVRLGNSGREATIEVLVMRLDPKELKLTPLE